MHGRVAEGLISSSMNKYSGLIQRNKAFQIFCFCCRKKCLKPNSFNRVSILNRMGHFTTPVVVDYENATGILKTFTIIPDYIEAEKLFPGTYEILEGEQSHGHIAFDNAHKHWEDSQLQDLTHDEIEFLGVFIRDHEEADLDGVDF